MMLLLQNDNGSCVAPQGCNEWYVGDTLSDQEFDCADVCGDEAVEDCAGFCNGTATIDLCGNCSNSNIPCEQDCMGEWGGSTEIGECGLCVGGSLTCPEEDDCYNVGFDDPCSTLGCCPYLYIKECSCNGSCAHVERIVMVDVMTRFRKWS